MPSDLGRVQAWPQVLPTFPASTAERAELEGGPGEGPEIALAVGSSMFGVPNFRLAHAGAAVPGLVA